MAEKLNKAKLRNFVEASSIKEAVKLIHGECFIYLKNVHCELCIACFASSVFELCLVFFILRCIVCCSL